MTATGNPGSSAALISTSPPMSGGSASTCTGTTSWTTPTHCASQCTADHTGKEAAAATAVTEAPRTAES